MLTWTAFNQMNSNYWSYFLTEICGLEPTVMGTVKAVTGVGEWFFVIIAAIIIERVWLKHGQYRSWLLIAAAGRRSSACYDSSSTRCSWTWAARTAG